MFQIFFFFPIILHLFVNSNATRSSCMGYICCMQTENLSTFHSEKLAILFWCCAVFNVSRAVKSFLWILCVNRFKNYRYTFAMFLRSDNLLLLVVVVFRICCCLNVYGNAFVVAWCFFFAIRLPLIFVQIVLKNKSADESWRTDKKSYISKLEATKSDCKVLQSHLHSWRPLLFSTLLLHLCRLKWLKIKNQVNCVWKGCWNSKDIIECIHANSTSCSVRSKIIGQNEEKHP